MEKANPKQATSFPTPTTMHSHGVSKIHGYLTLKQHQAAVLPRGYKTHSYSTELLTTMFLGQMS